ncbi:MAG TPA: hypothetical protein VMK65_02715 [Longimicrobiales bacterium]|nr:hypothetical protein [Longimicrobiales bacterium]
MMRRLLLLSVAASVAACAPKRVHEDPILENGERVRDVDAAALPAVQQAEAARAAQAERRDAALADGIADCAPAVCEAIARGEVALGMTRAQVLAATRTGDEAWTWRQSGQAGVLVPRMLTSAPRDAVSEVAMVQLRDGRVSAYSYRESQGLRLVASPADATTAGRAEALADMLVRQGDELAAAGSIDEALDRYDRASILDPSNAELEYRIATVLDKALRPVEALVRYQLFLHRMELEKIEARGDAYAKLADAIARAQQRIIVLERQGR